MSSDEEEARITKIRKSLIKSYGSLHGAFTHLDTSHTGYLPCTPSLYVALGARLKFKSSKIDYNDFFGVLRDKHGYAATYVAKLEREDEEESRRRSYGVRELMDRETTSQMKTTGSTGRSESVEGRDLMDRETTSQMKTTGRRRSAGVEGKDPMDRETTSHMETMGRRRSESVEGRDPVDRGRSVGASWTTRTTGSRRRSDSVDGRDVMERDSMAGTSQMRMTRRSKGDSVDGRDVMEQGERVGTDQMRMMGSTIWGNSVDGRDVMEQGERVDTDQMRMTGSTTRRRSDSVDRGDVMGQGRRVGTSQMRMTGSTRMADVGLDEETRKRNSLRQSPGREMGRTGMSPTGMTRNCVGLGEENEETRPRRNSTGEIPTRGEEIVRGRRTSNTMDGRDARTSNREMDMSLGSLAEKRRIVESSRTEMQSFGDGTICPMKVNENDSESVDSHHVNGNVHVENISGHDNRKLETADIPAIVLNGDLECRADFSNEDEEDSGSLAPIQTDFGISDVTQDLKEIVSSTDASEEHDVIKPSSTNPEIRDSADEESILAETSAHSTPRTPYPELRAPIYPGGRADVADDDMQLLLRLKREEDLILQDEIEVVKRPSPSVRHDRAMNKSQLLSSSQVSAIRVSWPPSVAPPSFITPPLSTVRRDYYRPTSPLPGLSPPQSRKESDYNYNRASPAITPVPPSLGAARISRSASPRVVPFQTDHRKLRLASQPRRRIKMLNPETKAELKATLFSRASQFPSSPDELELCPSDIRRSLHDVNPQWSRVDITSLAELIAGREGISRVRLSRALESIEDL